MSTLINWYAVFPQIDQLAIIRVYLVIVSNMDDNYIWYSNKESRAQIEWRWQMAESTVKYAIAQLKKKGFLKVRTRGIYEVSREYLLHKDDKV